MTRSMLSHFNNVRIQTTHCKVHFNILLKPCPYIASRIVYQNHQNYVLNFHDITKNITKKSNKLNIILNDISILENAKTVL